MAKLHELLAAEKTPTGAWNELHEDTMKKFKNPDNYFHGHSKSLKFVEDTPANVMAQEAAREEKRVVTTVYDTLEYALAFFGKAEDLQFQKNSTNRKASGDLMWHGNILLANVPVDELLGLEARLTHLRQLFLAIPTLDASKHWVVDGKTGKGIWTLQHPEETTKTQKQIVPIILHPATKEHPAQVKDPQVDVVIGKFTTQKWSGAATALQKAEALKRIDDLIVEVKQARMRANETAVEKLSIADILLPLLLEPLKSASETSKG